MKKRIIRILALLLVVILLLAARQPRAPGDSSSTLKPVYANGKHVAQEGWHFTRSTFGSGGMGASAGAYTLRSSFGLPFTGVEGSGPYQLISGYWVKADEVPQVHIYLPLISR